MHDKHQEYVEIVKSLDAVRGYIDQRFDVIQDLQRQVEQYKTATAELVAQHEEALDLARELIRQIGQVGYDHDAIWKWDQTKRVMEKLQKHPSYKAAEERRRQKYWNGLEAASREVATWPAWKRGGV